MRNSGENKGARHRDATIFFVNCSFNLDQFSSVYIFIKSYNLLYVTNSYRFSVFSYIPFDKPSIKQQTALKTIISA